MCMLRVETGQTMPAHSPQKNLKMTTALMRLSDSVRLPVTAANLNFTHATADGAVWVTVADLS